MSGDRRNVERLLVRYCRAIDEKRYDLLDDVFTADAALDFREAGGIEGSYAKVRPWLEKAMARFTALHHQLGNVELDVVGAEGTARSYVRAMHVFEQDGQSAHFEIGGVYRDEIELTDVGFRIRKRHLEVRFRVGELPRRA